jgi:hypothetical protein
MITLRQVTSIKAGIGDPGLPLHRQRSGKLVVAAAALISGSGIVERSEDLSMIRDFLPCRRVALLPSVDL